MKGSKDSTGLMMSDTKLFTTAVNAAAIIKPQATFADEGQCLAPVHAALRLPQEHCR